MTATALLRLEPPAAEIRPPADEPAPPPKRDSTKRDTRAGTLDLRAWAEAYMKQTGLKKNALAEQIGYSRSTVSRWLEGSYDAEDQTAIAAAIQTLRDRVEGPGGLSTVIGFRETLTARAIFGALQLAGPGQGNLVILVGESGAGKSEAIKEARRRASRNGQPLPIYIEGTVFTSGYALVSALAKEVGVDQRGNPDAMMRAIADKLHREPRIIILDEAHYAQERAIEALRQIRDMSGVGVVIVGTTMLAGISSGKLGQADLMHELLLHRPHLEQVVSRAVIIPVPGLDADEAESIAADVLGRIQPDALERLLALAGESIRRFVRIVDGIKQTRARRGTNGVVRLDEVDAAWRRLYPPQRGRA